MRLLCTEYIQYSRYPFTFPSLTSKIKFSFPLQIFAIKSPNRNVSSPSSVEYPSYNSPNTLHPDYQHTSWAQTPHHLDKAESSSTSPTIPTPPTPPQSPESSHSTA